MKVLRGVVTNEPDSDSQGSDGDVWARRRDNLDDAEETVNAILKRFEHWCLYDILFSISAKREDTESAIRYGAIAATMDHEHKGRVDLYERYADYLYKNGYPTETALLYKLIELIREEEGWKRFHPPEDFSYPEDVVSLNKKGVIARLAEFWNAEKERGVIFREGRISTVLPNGKSGFIRDDSGESYYFNSRDFTTRVWKLEEGMKVRYALVERLDQSKNEVKLNAVQISPVPEG